MLKYTIFKKRTEPMDFIFCLVGATLSGLSFVSEHLWFLPLVAPGFFFFSLYNEKRPFLKGFIFGLIFYMFNTLFLSSLDISHLTGNLFSRKFFPFIAYMAVCIIEGLFTGIFTKLFIILKIKTKKSFHSLLFASSWIIYEFLLGLPFSDFGYPFGRISIPFAEKPFLIQTSSLFGMLFISFIVIYFATSSAMSFIEKSAKYMYLPIAVLTLNLACSALLYALPENGEGITVKCVQNGYGGYEKWAAPPLTIIRNSAKEFQGADIVVFSECTIPITLNKTSYLSLLSEEAENNNVTVLAGSLYRDENGKNYTSVYHFPYKENEIYHKRHPVPYGEYFPLFDLFIDDLKEAGLSKGKTSKPLGKYLAGPVICFDSMFPEYSRDTVKKGARILCISTNDSWFSKGEGARLHLYHSIYRAVENGRYVARSACTGISAVIDSKGNIKSFVPLNKTASITEKVLLLDEITPYTFFGDAPILLYAFSVIAFSLINSKRRKKIAG